MRSVVSLGLIVFTSIFAASAAAQTPTEEQVFFSFDDVSIPWRDNVKLTLERPKKHPNNPVMKPGGPESVDEMATLLYGTVLKEGDKFRMWYIAWPRWKTREPAEMYWRPVAYAESTDGVNWTKPELGLVEYRGNKQNNIVLIEPGDTALGRPYDFVSVLRDDAEPDAARRYKMAYIIYDEKLGYGTTATAVSADGLSWKLNHTEPFTKGHFENTSLIRFDGLYYMTGQNIGRGGGTLHDGTDRGRLMTGFFSPDFEHWSNGRALNFFRSHAADAPESHGQEMHMGAGLWNRNNVVVGLYGRWYGDTMPQPNAPGPKPRTFIEGLKIDLGLCYSTDAIHYREPVENFVFVPRGASHEWDSQAILQAHAFHNTDTETLIWYSHWDTSSPWPIPLLPEKIEGLRTMGVGLLTMRRDGFGYLSKVKTESNPARGMHRRDAEASVLTKRLPLKPGVKLIVNVDGVTPEAPFTVSLVDDAERPLSGTQPAKVTTSGVRVPVDLDTSKLAADQPARIRIEWPGEQANPKFYALYIVP